MKCELCEVDISVRPLYRNAPKGGPPHWRCEDCLNEDPPAAVKELVDDLAALRGEEATDG